VNREGVAGQLETCQEYFHQECNLNGNRSRGGTVPIFAAHKAFGAVSHRRSRENGTVPFACTRENCPRRPVNTYTQQVRRGTSITPPNTRWLQSKESDRRQTSNRTSWNQRLIQHLECFARGCHGGVHLGRRVRRRDEHRLVLAARHGSNAVMPRTARSTEAVGRLAVWASSSRSAAPADPGQLRKISDVPLP